MVISDRKDWRFTVEAVFSAPGLPGETGKPRNHNRYTLENSIKTDQMALEPCRLFLLKSPSQTARGGTKLTAATTAMSLI